MKFPYDERFREERKRFALRYNCEVCALFDPQRQTCAHGFPTHEHRRSYCIDDPTRPLAFCKEFELI